MEQASSRQRPSPDESAWWLTFDEEYWKALLEQGEAPSVGALPVDPPEVYALPSPEETLTHGGAPTTQETTDHTRVQDEWRLARQALERGERFHLRVCGANRGGILVQWNGLQGFVPGSHLVQMPRGQNPRERLSDLLGRIGDSLTLRLIEVDPIQKRLVLSERAALSDCTSPVEVLNGLRPGDTRCGTVTNLTAFGAFVDLGGVEGLIHVSELAWSRVRHPGDVLHVGKEVEVQVLGVSPEEGRVALSLKRLRPNPWSRVEARYQVGQVVEGMVTSVVDFGAFVCVEDGLEGLVHSSELGDGGFLHPKSVLREGDNVRVRILNIDATNHRMGLSLRQVGDRGRHG